MLEIPRINVNAVRNTEDRSWAIGLTQREFEIGLKQRSPFCDVVPLVNEYINAGRSQNDEDETGVINPLAGERARMQEQLRLSKIRDLREQLEQLEQQSLIVKPLQNKQDVDDNLGNVYPSTDEELRISQPKEPIVETRFNQIRSCQFVKDGCPKTAIKSKLALDKHEKKCKFGLNRRLTASM